MPFKGHRNQEDRGLVQMVSTSESFLVQVAGVEVILHVQSAESKGQDQTALNVMERYILHI